MKVCTVQPPYSADFADAEKNFKKTLALLDEIPSPTDLIVLPEAATVPALAGNRENLIACFRKYHEPLSRKVRETALRCGANVFFGSYEEDGERLLNTVFLCTREGDIRPVYRKQHLTPGEVKKLGYSDGRGYIWEPGLPDCVTVDGIRYAFLVCYDFYFYEAFPVLAKMRPDIIIGCSHQRSDLHSALETSVRFLSYNTNAYVVRASVSMGEDSPLGGCSMTATPRGDILCNAESRIGLSFAEFAPEEKYEKPAGFGGRLSAHWEYVERGRRPWKYRPAGPATVPGEADMPYPRICAHRGFHTAAPENSMPAYGAAVALGASEIEFDLWETKDGEIVSIHDAKLDRTSDGTGHVYDCTYEELLRYDFGAKYDEKFRGLKILRFEEILRKFAGQTVMNVHIKSHDKYLPENEEKLKKIIALVRKYDCEKYVYFMCGNDAVQAQLRDLAPDIPRCMGAGADKWNIVERGRALGCSKVQLFKPYLNQEMVDKAHACGMRCNVYYADDPEEARQYLDMGIDCVLTNDYLGISTALGLK